MKRKGIRLYKRQKNKATNSKIRKMNIRRSIYSLVVFAIVVVLISSCAVGPNFQRVEMETQDTFRFQTTPTDSVTMLDWNDLFKDTVLTALIDSALKNNLNAQIAASRINEARAYLGMAKADMYPSLSVGGNGNYGNTMSVFPTGQSARASGYVNANVNWELVFWGKYRRASEAARAELVASEYGLRALQISLIAEVANSYYMLLDYQKRLEIANDTWETRKESSRIIGERFDKGIVPELDLNQAEIQEAYAAAAVPTLERSIAFTENALSVLIGEIPQAILTNYTIEDLVTPDEVPVGLPSQLLTRRPDILEAEQLLKAQNARIGVAQAMRFPSISLTGMLGLASPDLSNFNASDALTGSIGASLFGPIFHFGKNKRRVDAERERTEQLRFNYKNAVLSAFRETEDALVTIETLNRELVFVQKQVNSAQNAAKLSRERYDGGVTSYLEVLEAERTLFNIELYYSELLQRRMTGYTDLYKTLGGGWVDDVVVEDEKTN